MRLILSVIILLINWFNISAQSFSLDDCLNYAYKHRYELKKQENVSNLSRLQYKYSKYNLLPSIQSDIGYNFNKYNNSENNENGQVSLSGTLTLFDGFKSINKIKKSKLMIAQNQNKTDAIRNTIKLEVIQTYYEILLTKERINILNNSLSTTKKQIKTVSIAVESGKQSKIDLLELEALMAQEETDLLDAKGQYNEVLIKLKKVINFQEKNITIDGVSTTIPDIEIDVDSVYLEAISFLPEFEIVKNDSLHWHYSIEQAKAGFFPLLTTTAMLSSSYQGNSVNVSGLGAENNKFRSQFKDNYTQQIGLSLIIPIYSKHTIRSQVIEYQKLLQDVSVEEAQLYQDIYFEIEQICNETKTRKESIGMLEKRFQYYKQIFQMRKEQYVLGMLSITDYLIADSNMKNSELSLLYEKYNLRYNLRLIDHYCGK